MPITPLATATIGRTGITVTRLGLGGVPLAGLYGSVEAQQGEATVREALDLGVRYFDTAPMYGVGASERRMGAVLAEQPRDSYVLSSKVGRLVDAPDTRPGWHFDFSRDGVLRSFHESLERLGLERIDILLIHDPDDDYAQAIGEAFPALAELRSQGLVGAIGAGMNQWEMELRLAQEGDFDCFLLAGRYTLLEQTSLGTFLPYCEQQQISVIVGGPYNSGILASDLAPGAKYNYRDAPPEVIQRARRINGVCVRHGVELKAAALQFPLAHPAVAAIIPGAASPEEMRENRRLLDVSIPPALWDELKHEGLLHEAAPVPAA